MGGVLLFAFALSASYTKAAAPNWDVTGTWNAEHAYAGHTYTHVNNVTQATDGSLTGSGGWNGYVDGSPTGSSNTWDITSGSNVSGNAFHMNYHYTSGAVCDGYVDAVINGDGSMTGNWNDNCGGAPRTGEWSTLAGIAKLIPVTYDYNFKTLDNGMNGLWATDYFQSRITITPTTGNCYNVVRDDGGTFQVIDNAKSPGGDGSTPVGNGTKGNIEGGAALTICGTIINSPDLSDDDMTTGTYANYAVKYFHRFFSSVSSYDITDWGWTFSTCFNGTWTDNNETETAFASDPNAMGDIKGAYIPCLTDKNICKNGGWKLYTTVPTFKNQGDCVSYVQSNANAIGNRKDNQ